MWGLITQIGIGIAILSVPLSAIKMNQQWQEAVVLRLGKYHRTTKAGIWFKIPFIEADIRRDMRITTLDIESQEAITKDNISVTVNAIVFMKIRDAKKSVLNVEKFFDTVQQISKTTLRDVIGQENLDDLLEKRKKVAKKIKQIVDESVEDWGANVTNIELQNIVMPEDMKRAFAVQAEAERESKAIKIKAKAEYEASEMLKKAGDRLKKNPIALQLRQLETLSDVSKDQSNTIIFALPTETLIGSGASGLAAMASINSSAARRKIWYEEKEQQKQTETEPEEIEQEEDEE